jgi:hypothetical protein
MQRFIIDRLEQLSKSYEDEKGHFDNDFYSETTFEQVKKFIMTMAPFHPSWDISEDNLKARFSEGERFHMANNPITVIQSSFLKVKKDIWLTEHRKVSVGWVDGNLSNYRNRYFKYLDDNGRSDKVISEIKESTLRIVSNFGDPASSKSFYTKAMVVGSVQSGKTGNFNGVINTAIDIGYELIIVFSGITEDLREQTQVRIEKDVIGTKGAGARGIGVGEKYGFKDSINSITSKESDFSRNVLLTNPSLYTNTNIIICKKNVGVLKNILIWLNQYIDKNNPQTHLRNEQIDKPLLIIDDEADNASLNNLGHKGKDYATQTNLMIRSVLKLFSRKVYLGYTATPFANILQDRNETPNTKYSFKYNGALLEFEQEDNLFPDDFIELLEPPSNYSGIKQFFQTKDPNIIKIDSLVAKPIDFSDQNYYTKIPPRFYKDGDVPTSSYDKGTRAAKKADKYPNKIDGMPVSLKEAIKCFILSVAIRKSREKEMKNSPIEHIHNTMLIHIALFSDWQNKLKKLVEVHLTEVESKINYDPIGSEIWLEFERVWKKYYLNIVGDMNNHLTGYKDPYLTSKDYKKDIEPLIFNAIDKIEVLAINSQSEDKIRYPDKDPKKFIAIGGNCLSRGFTLEGLTINYFLRKANTVDTLMQMARWFGYRPGYLDCCKLFTLQQNIEKFNEASLVMEDLENKFKDLAKQELTPRDYTLWIRHNPDVIRLTRNNFMRGASVRKLTFSDTVQQSTQFKIEKNIILESFTAFKDHIKSIEWDDTRKGYKIYETDQLGLFEFLDLPNTMLNLNKLGLPEFLKSCQKNLKLTKWKIVIKTSENAKGEEVDIGKFKFKMSVRSGPSIGDDENNPRNNFISLIDKDNFKARNATIISPSDFAVTIDPLKKKEIDKDFKKSTGKKSVPDSEYRKHIDDDTGILVIYLMDLQSVFKVDQNEKNGVTTNKLLREYSIKEGLNTLKNVPLIGFALGFPSVRGVGEGVEITQHIFKVPEEMSLEELRSWIAERDFGIDVESKNWTRDELLSEIIEYDGVEEDEDILQVINESE